MEFTIEKSMLVKIECPAKGLLSLGKRDINLVSWKRVQGSDRAQGFACAWQLR
jgi:hypothetical protein